MSVILYNVVIKEQWRSWCGVKLKKENIDVHIYVECVETMLFLLMYVF